MGGGHISDAVAANAAAAAAAVAAVDGGGGGGSEAGGNGGGRGKSVGGVLDGTVDLGTSNCAALPLMSGEQAAAAAVARSTPLMSGKQAAAAAAAGGAELNTRLDGLGRDISQQLEAMRSEMRPLLVGHGTCTILLCALCALCACNVRMRANQPASQRPAPLRAPRGTWKIVAPGGGEEREDGHVPCFLTCLTYLLTYLLYFAPTGALRCVMSRRANSSRRIRTGTRTKSCWPRS